MTTTSTTDQPVPLATLLLIKGGRYAVYAIGIIVMVTYIAPGSAPIWLAWTVIATGLPLTVYWGASAFGNTRIPSKPKHDAFTVISEPEVQLHRQPNGQVRLEVIGLNAFNAAKRTISSPSTESVVSILTDTAYDGQSFKVRLINIRQHQKNQRTLRLLKEAFGDRISDEKWAQMTTYTTVPFNLPMTEQEADQHHAANPSLPRPGSKIAVKIIDRTGTEHMTMLDDPRAPRWY